SPGPACRPSEGSLLTHFVDRRHGPSALRRGRSNDPAPRWRPSRARLAVHRRSWRARVLTRSHGLGNDYLVADPAELPFAVSPARVRLLCDRHEGVGSDGLLVLDGASGVRIVNPDGSEAEKSGNGLRIFARWLFDTRRVASRTFTIEVGGARAGVEVHVDGG